MTKLPAGDGTAAGAERDALLSQEFIDSLKRRYCIFCGGGFEGEHVCGRRK